MQIKKRRGVALLIVIRYAICYNLFKVVTIVYEFNPDYNSVLSEIEKLLESNDPLEKKINAIAELSKYRLYCQVKLKGNAEKIVLDKREIFTQQLLDKYPHDQQEDILSRIDELRSKGIDEFRKEQYTNNPYYRDAFNNTTSIINTPKCPTCQSTNIQKIGKLEHAASVGVFGLFSKKINKTFECNNCGYSW